MNKILLLLVVMLCSIISMAQSTDAMLFGDVKAKEGGRHLAHAVISIKGTNLKTQCDGTGHYKIGNLPVESRPLLLHLVAINHRN